MKAFAAILLASAVAFSAPACAGEFEPAPVYLPLVGDDSYADMEALQIKSAIRIQMKYPESMQVVEMRLRPTYDLAGNFNGHVVCGKYIALSADGSGKPIAPYQFYTVSGSNAWTKAWLGNFAAQGCLDAGF